MKMTDALLVSVLVVALPACDKSNDVTGGDKPSQPPTGSFAISPSTCPFSTSKT